MFTLTVSRVNSLLTLCCLVGLGLSLYAYTVELQIERNEKYSPMCDISPQMSCSKAFKSPYGKGFGIFGKFSTLNQPNSLFGLMFYSMMATLAQSNSKFPAWFMLMAIFLSNLLSLYFAYILYFVLYDFCVVCVGTYVVNILNLLLIQAKLKLLLAPRQDPIKKAN
ncbi:unnamed protein product [Phyllotreta striolata]|uniref:vitamin-K-epoxide reductase (warfarin-sensitive) n=1 Tax=Phyllotreta striolata TaxID=444603 RepID=A0A9N9TKB1_PHYSR|nr:unnamed protein product [Phyllotreta striolata]CAG9857100.1 unnamed protein product [Phyllotreta striolata]